MMKRFLSGFVITLVFILMPLSAYAIPDLTVGIEDGIYYYDPAEYYVGLDGNLYENGSDDFSELNYITDSFAVGGEDNQGWLLTGPGEVTIFSWGPSQDDLAGVPVYFAATDLENFDNSGSVQVDTDGLSGPLGLVGPDDEWVDEPHPDGYHGYERIWNIGDPALWEESADGLGTQTTIFVSFSGSTFDFWAFSDNVLTDGLYTDGAGNHAEPFSPRSHNTSTSTAPPVPEPATLLLLGGGLATLAIIRKKFSA